MRSLLQLRNAAMEMRINGQFPIFSCGTGHTLAFFDGFGFDENGIREMWKKFRTLERNLLSFLSKEFSELSEGARRTICEQKLASVKEEIVRKDMNFRECLSVSRIKRDSGL